MPNENQRALHFGAGNIGRGFIGPLLAKSGYIVTFADVNEKIISLLNDANHYSVEVLAEKQTTEIIHNVEGVISTSSDVIDLFDIKGDGEVKLITTSVGPTILPRIAGAIAQGLERRKKAGAGSLNVIACENMVGATHTLRDTIFERLKKDGKDDVLKWVQEHVGWPNCAVDRIVPPFERPPAASELDVGVEPFFEWAIDEQELKGSDFKVKGAKLVDNLPAYLERKLYTLNCAHASLAFLGWIKGYSTILDTMQDPDIRKTVHAELEETGAALIRKHNFPEKDHKQYIETIFHRFENPSLKDEVARVARQPLRKLGPKERLVAPVNMLRGYGLGRKNLLVAIAAALRYDVQDDEESVDLQKRIKEKGVEKTLREVTEWGQSKDKGVEEDVQFVLEEYEKFKKAGKKAQL